MGRRDDLGFLAAPMILIAPGLAAAWLATGSIFERDVAIGVGLVYLCAWTVGIPLHLLLRRCGRRHVAAYAGGGFAGMYALVLAVVAWSAFRHAADGETFLEAFGTRWEHGRIMPLAVGAALCAAIFWWIAVRPRPERASGG